MTKKTTRRGKEVILDLMIKKYVHKWMKDNKIEELAAKMTAGHTIVFNKSTGEFTDLLPTKRTTLNKKKI